VGQLYYPIAKTLAEKAGWEFAKETGFDVVMINPGTALGPLIPPRINSSMAVLAGVLKGTLDSLCYTLYYFREKKKKLIFLVFFVVVFP
jgi:nucleoside-diphosphate-sugar epimerase